jgi:hypothetical protein
MDRGALQKQEAPGSQQFVFGRFILTEEKKNPLPMTFFIFLSHVPR